MAVSRTQDEVIEGALFDAHTTHARLGSKTHHLAHDVFYLALPLSRIEALPRRLMAHNGRGVFALNDRDYGHGDTDLRSWIAAAFASCGETLPEGEITLVTMPRIFGLGFNPVSFWFCQDREGGLRAVMAEVNNTFGERHCYLCRHADGRVIAPEDEMRTEKVFHVSPFMPVAGHYLFRFRLTDEKIAIRVDLHRDGDKVLTTTLNGRRRSAHDRASAASSVASSAANAEGRGHDSLACACAFHQGQSVFPSAPAACPVHNTIPLVCLQFRIHPCPSANSLSIGPSLPWSRRFIRAAWTLIEPNAVNGRSQAWTVVLRRPHHQ